MITENEMRIVCLRVAFDDACRASKKAWQEADADGGKCANRGSSGKYATAYAADDKAAAIRRELVDLLQDA